MRVVSTTFDNKSINPTLNCLNKPVINAIYMSAAAKNKYENKNKTLEISRHRLLYFKLRSIKLT